MTRQRRILVVTGPPYVFGGVAFMARWLADDLERRGHRITVAHYAALGREPDLSAGLAGTLIGRKPAVRRYRDWNGKEFVSVGCRLPEIESNYYRDSDLWRELIAAHDFHVAVGGTLPVAWPLAAAGVPHLVWCASDVDGDRAERRRVMSLPRLLFEKIVVGPKLAGLERRVLHGPGRILAISEFTRKKLRATAGNANREIARLPIPVDLERFHPPDLPPTPGVIGCAGRLTDPRKNLDLLLEAVAILHRNDITVRLELAGDVPADLGPRAERLGIADKVVSRGRLDDDAYAAFQRGIDVLAISSTQEGHNIVGIEAMASGVPVVSTRCGGPEDFVEDGVTGYLTGLTARELADGLARVVVNRERRTEMGVAARRVAETGYGIEAFRRVFDAEWSAAWPADALDP